jgi:hypothetical protein
MSSSNEKNKKLDLIKENFNHARHIENERLQFVQIYSAIVAGFIFNRRHINSTIPHIINITIYHRIVWIHINN